jgi:hypothetical protein
MFKNQLISLVDYMLNSDLNERACMLCRKRKTVSAIALTVSKLVAWDGIEPSTRGFSKHVASKTSMFMGLAA